MSIDLRQGGGAQAHPNIAEAPSIFSAADLSHMADTAARGLPPPEAHPLRRRRPNRAAPRVDPPEKGVAIPENTPGLATMAFPCIFQTGAADFHASRRVNVGFMDWARHILMNEGGRAIKDKRFRYWVFNTNGRRMAVSKRQVFLDRVPGASEVRLSDITKADNQSLVRNMIAYTTEIPGTLGESTQARQRLEAMVDQIEWETSRRGENEGVGRIHALFMTLTAAVYKWERLNRIIRRWKGLPETADGESEEEKKVDSPKKHRRRRK